MLTLSLVYSTQAPRLLFSEHVHQATVTKQRQNIYNNKRKSHWAAESDLNVVKLTAKKQHKHTETAKPNFQKVIRTPFCLTQLLSHLQA